MVHGGKLIDTIIWAYTYILVYNISEIITKIIENHLVECEIRTNYQSTVLENITRNII